MYPRWPVCLTYILLAALVSLSGCARKPWRAPVTDNTQALAIATMEDIRFQEEQRATCYDAKVQAFFTSHIRNQAVSGYTQFMQPDSVKFISSNPLGQPIFAFVSIGKSFQLVNTLEQLFTQGDLSALATYYSLPPIARSSNWTNWLTGHLPVNATITDIREDKDRRGVWVSTLENKQKQDASKEDILSEHLLIDIENRRLATRIITDQADATQVRISYSGWVGEEQGQLAGLPGKITLTELDYGGKLVLNMSELQTMSYCNGKDFTLRQPPGYRYKPLTLGN